jgi:hypothetical protein
MIVYHGGAKDTLGTVAPDNSMDVLHSFALTKRTTWSPWWRRLFIDSGAFSVWKSGKSVDIQKYLSYINEWEPYFERTVFASLDVIGDPNDPSAHEQSFSNYKWLYDRVPKGVVLIPVVHFGEPLHLIDRYAEYTSYIGLGGSVGKSSEQRMRVLDKVFHRYPDPQKMGFHGFGVTAPKLITAFPWKSIDSTRSLRWAMYGLIETVFHKSFRVGKSTKDHLRPNKKLGAVELRIIMDKAKEYGVDWDSVCNFEGGQNERQYWNARTIDDIAKGGPAHYIGASKSQYFELR